MSEQNYVGIEPKHCSKCGEDYTPIISSDECPHSKIGVSEQDELLLTDEEIEGLARDYAEGFERFWLSGEPDMKMAITFARVKVREAQLTKAKQHYKQEIEKLFKEIEEDFETDIDTLYVLHIARFRWQSIKNKYLGGDDGTEEAG